MPLIECDRISILEISKIPKSYLSVVNQEHTESQVPIKDDRSNNQFERFLGAILYSNIASGFRIQSVEGLLKLFYLAQQNKTEVISSAFSAQFPGFVISNSHNSLSYEVNQPIFLTEIIGVPNPVSHSLDGLAESMIQTDSQIVYQVWTYPKNPGFVTKKITERKYQSALEKSQIQESYESWLRGRETRTRYDADALRSTKWHEAAFERISAERLLEARVIIASWGHDHAYTSMQMAVNTLLATISYSAKKEKLRTKSYSGKRALALLTDALLMGKKLKGILLLPKDAVPLVEIPHIELGVTQSSITSFSTANTIDITSSSLQDVFRVGDIALGHIYRGGKSKPERMVFLNVEDLRRHTFVLGMTGSGKSSTKNRIIIDAWKNGIPSLIIEPVKSDARALLASISDLRIFTIGREPVAPFRMNPFSVENGVPVQAHIDQLYFSFLAAWPLYGILANHLRKVIVRTYSKKGWNPLTDSRGEQISLQDFRDEAERYTNELKYGSELSQDFKGAILTRVEDLCDPSRAAIFNTSCNLPIAELLQVPTILELRHIKDPEFKALILNLIINRVSQYFELLGPATHLRSLLLIDEAHRFLRELPPALDVSEMAVSKRQVLDQFEDLTAESRSYGLGLVILDQAPSQLSRGVLKNCHTKIVHRLESPDDSHLAALLTGCNNEQQAHMTLMKEGEAIIRGIRDHTPRNIQVLHDPDFTEGMKHHWTDDDVAQRMKIFYQEHPEFAATPEIPRLDSLGVIEDRELVSLRVQVEDIVRSTGYHSNYLKCKENPNAEELRAIEELIVYYSIHYNLLDRSPQETIHAFIDATEAVHGPSPYSLNLHFIQQRILDHQRTRYSDSGGDSDRS